MTICVPKKPFEYTGIGVAYGLMFSWIITLPLLILNLTSQYKFGDVGVELLAGGFSLIISLAYLNAENKEKHWIQWCEKKPVNTSQRSLT